MQGLFILCGILYAEIPDRVSGISETQNNSSKLLSAEKEDTDFFRGKFASSKIFFVENPMSKIFFVEN